MNAPAILRHLGLGLIVAGVVVALGACAAMDAGADKIITATSGMTFYTFDKDTANSAQSTCYGGCAEEWPPASAADASGQGFGSITRTDGSRQLTYQGRPLYYFAGDSKPGDRNGDGLGGIWHVVPAGGQPRSTSPGRSGYY